MIKSDDVRKGSFLDVIIWAGIWVALLHVVLSQTGCQVTFDNPFYKPRTFDVNKQESKGANNYLEDNKKTPGVAQ